MKRLNFEHLLAEKSGMNRIDPFFILILVLLSGLCVVYKSAQYDLSGLKFQLLVNKQLKHQISVLQLKQKEMELAQERAAVSKPLLEQQKRQVSSLESSAAELDLNPLKQSQAMYKEAAKICKEAKKETQCIEKIDFIVTQFPESKWAGHSLLLLTHVYLKNKRFEQARELMKVVRVEFKKYPDLIRQLKEIEKNSL